MHVYIYITTATSEQLQATQQPQAEGSCLVCNNEGSNNKLQAQQK